MYAQDPAAEAQDLSLVLFTIAQRRAEVLQREPRLIDAGFAVWAICLPFCRQHESYSRLMQERRAEWFDTRSAEQRIERAQIYFTDAFLRLELDELARLVTAENAVELIAEYLGSLEGEGDLVRDAVPSEAASHTMNDRPVFVYAATYADRADALTDYDSLIDLHMTKLVDTYDVALVTKDADGKIHLRKHEKPTQHGTWGGIAIGAVATILARTIGAAAIGGPVGGIGGHLRPGISREDIKELSDLLEGGEAALIVIGESRVEEQLDKALTRAEKSLEKEIALDSRKLRQEFSEAEQGL